MLVLSVWAAIHVLHSGHLLSWDMGTPHDAIIVFREGTPWFYTSPVSSLTHTVMVFKFELLNFPFCRKLINSRPCRDLNPGPHRWQAAVLTIEL